jgi:competence protein ComEA
VDIVGAVQRPGLYYFSDGVRVADAINSAGGFAPDANRDAVNLAIRLKDEEQIRVPRVGDADISPEQAPSAEAEGSALLDLNTADAAALESLPDIGPAIAQRIMEYRNVHGPFRNIEQLQDVSGIGAATISALRDLVVVNP